MTNEVQVAEAIARDAHAGQFEESTGEPYIWHVQRVVELAMSLPPNLRGAGVWPNDVMAVAWLHDVLEDAPSYTSHRLRTAGITDIVVNAVVLLTRVKDTPFYDYQPYIQRLRESKNALAIGVKIADLQDHLRPNCPERLRPRYEAALRVLLATAEAASDSSFLAQAIGELEGLAQHYDRRGVAITAAQLRLVLEHAQQAGALVEEAAALRETVEAQRGVMHKITESVALMETAVARMADERDDAIARRVKVSAEFKRLLYDACLSSSEKVRADQAQAAFQRLRDRVATRRLLTSEGAARAAYDYVLEQCHWAVEPTKEPV